MAAWHRSRRADLVLRATGLLLCWVSYSAIARLVAMHVPSQKAGVLAYGIAAAGFMAASAGSALALWGHHLFDEIEVCARWRRRPDLNVSMAVPIPLRADFDGPGLRRLAREDKGHQPDSPSYGAGSHL